MFALAFWTESQKSLVLAIALVWRRDSFLPTSRSKGESRYICVECQWARGQ